MQVQGNPRDILHGPRTGRRCTDSVWPFIFFGALFWFLVLSIDWVQDGLTHRLYYPRDFRGGYCGLAAQRGGPDLQGYERLTYVMNVATVVQPIAEQLVCSRLAQQEMLYRGLMRSSGLEEHARRCRGVAGAEELSSEGLAEEIGGRMAELTHASSAGLFSNASLNAGLYAGIWEQADIHFLQVCASSCSPATANASGVTATEVRRFLYRMPPDAPLARAFQLLGSNPRVDPRIRETINEMFVFSALPQTVCPYEAHFCVPVPGVKIVEIGPRDCEMRVSSAAAVEVGKSSANMLEDTANHAVKSSQSVMGAGWVDAFLASMDSFIFTAVASVCIGLTFLVVLRFFTRAFVWASIFAIGTLLLIAGVAILSSKACTQAEDCPAAQVEIQLYCGIGVLACAGLWAVFIYRMRRSIRVAIALNKVAAMFMAHTKAIVLVSLLEAVVGVALCIWCALSAASLASRVPEGHTPDGYYDGPEHCPSEWLGAYAWRDMGNASAVGDPCSGDRGDTAGITPRCWRCAEPRFVIDGLMAVVGFCFLWFSFFLVAVAQCTVAGACAVWFFAKLGRKSSRPAVWIGFRNVLRYHLGSLAGGSLAVVMTWPLRKLLAWLQTFMMRLKRCANGNCLLELIFLPFMLVFSPILWFYQRYLRFLNKHAYIQIALYGLNFCTSARNAVFLMLRNFLRFGALAAIRALVSVVFFSMTLVTTLVVGHWSLQLLHPEVGAFLPTVLNAAVGTLVGSLYSSVIVVSVDTALQCMMVTSELDLESDGAEFVPRPLRIFLPDFAGRRMSTSGSSVSSEESYLTGPRLKGKPLVEAMQKLLDATFQARSVPGKHKPIHLKAVSVEQMQNLDTMRAYLARRKDLAAKRRECPKFSVLTEHLGGDLTTHCPLDWSMNEYIFFHGTSEDAAKSILQDDFRLPTSHTHGGIYGAGIYMAESNSKAHSYCTRDAMKGWPMLVLRATLAKVHNVATKFPDKSGLKQGAQRGLYDCVCGDRRQIQQAFGGWREFIVYDVNQVLAEYLVWVKEK